MVGYRGCWHKLVCHNNEKAFDIIIAIAKRPWNDLQRIPDGSVLATAFGGVMTWWRVEVNKYSVRYDFGMTISFFTRNFINESYGQRSDADTQQFLYTVFCIQPKLETCKHFLDIFHQNKQVLVWNPTPCRLARCSWPSLSVYAKLMKPMISKWNRRIRLATWNSRLKKNWEFQSINKNCLELNIHNCETTKLLLDLVKNRRFTYCGKNSRW